MDILIIEDLADSYNRIAEVFPDDDKAWARDLDSARAQLKNGLPDVIILDGVFPDKAGQDEQFLAPRVLDDVDAHCDRTGDRRPIIVFVSGQDQVAATFSDVASWLDNGRIDDVLPTSLATPGWRIFQAILKHRVRRLLEFRPLQPVSALLGTMKEHGIITSSTSMIDPWNTMVRLAGSKARVFIGGPTGTGKTHFAEILHRMSGRTGPFVPVEAASLGGGDQHMVESYLFGNVKNFPNNTPARLGFFRQAHGGTIFIDNVDAMSMEVQAKLLRVVEKGLVRPLGADKEISVDVRIVTASNKDLEELAKEGKFRLDLYYRIGGIIIALPSLAQRGADDVSLLIQHFLGIYVGHRGQVRLDADVLRRFRHYDWPGNVRQLMSWIESIVLTCNSPVTLDRLPEKIKKAFAEASSATATGERGSTDSEAARYSNAIVEELWKLDEGRDRGPASAGPLDPAWPSAPTEHEAFEILSVSQRYALRTWLNENGATQGPKHVRVSVRISRLVCYAKRNGAVTVTLARELTGVGEAQANGDIMVLVGQGILSKRPEPIGRAHAFQLKPETSAT